MNINIPSSKDVREHPDDLIAPFREMVLLISIADKNYNEMSKNLSGVMKAVDTIQRQFELFLKDNNTIDEATKIKYDDIIVLLEASKKKFEEGKKETDDEMKEAKTNISSLLLDVAVMSEQDKHAKDNYVTIHPFLKTKTGLFLIAFVFFVVLPLLNNFAYNFIDGVFERVVGKTIKQTFMTAPEVLTKDFNQLEKEMVE